MAKMVINKQLIDIGHTITHGHQVKIHVPFDACILSFNLQSESLAMWYLIPSQSAHETGELKPRRIETVYIYMTGEHEEMDVNNLEFIGTFLLDSGKFVIHVFRELG